MNSNLPKGNKMTKERLEEIRNFVKEQNRTEEDKIKYDWVIDTYLRCPELIPTFIIQMDDYCDNEKEITEQLNYEFEKEINKAKAFKVVLCYKW